MYELSLWKLKNFDERINNSDGRSSKTMNDAFCILCLKKFLSRIAEILLRLKNSFQERQ